MAKSLADGPTFGHAMTKRCIHQEWSMGIDEAIEAEAQAQAICMQTKDYERAYEAFVKKADPRLPGKLTAKLISRRSRNRFTAGSAVSRSHPQQNACPRQARACVPVEAIRDGSLPPADLLIKVRDLNATVFRSSGIGLVL